VIEPELAKVLEAIVQALEVPESFRLTAAGNARGALEAAKRPS